MRRAIALSLMMLFGFLLMAPLLASDPDANLPACCRRNGQHHCIMQRLAADASHPGFTTVSARCPCCPFGAGGFHSATFHPQPGSLFFAEIHRHPQFIPQTQAHYRLSMDRSRQKRGPPSSSLLA